MNMLVIFKMVLFKLKFKSLSSQFQSLVPRPRTLCRSLSYMKCMYAHRPTRQVSIRQALTKGSIANAIKATLATFQAMLPCVLSVQLANLRTIPVAVCESIYFLSGSDVYFSICKEGSMPCSSSLFLAIQRQSLDAYTCDFARTLSSSLALSHSSFLFSRSIPFPSLSLSYPVPLAFSVSCSLSLVLCHTHTHTQRHIET